MKILIAEDDLVSQRLVQKMLQERGHCDCVGDGMQAIEAIETAYKSEAPYNLLCIDVSMPKANGIEVLKALHEIEERLKVPAGKRSKTLMITASEDPDHFISAIEEGSHWYITKPIKREELFEAIEDLGL